MKPKWKRVTCDRCSGYGVVADYSQYDFHGPKECRCCYGSGYLWQSPNNRLAVYPGGPFRGIA